MNSAWRKLWLDRVTKQDLGFEAAASTSTGARVEEEPKEDREIVDDIISLG